MVLLVPAPSAPPLGGLLLLEPQGPRSPAGYPIVQLVLALLTYGVMMIWLWCMRWTVASKADKRAQQQKRMHMVEQQQQEPDISTQDLWDDAWSSWKNNGYSSHIPRRQ